MAAEVGLNQTAVARIWRAFGLQPHRTETWKLSKDPLFVDKVRDVVGLYLNPPERAVVLCVDEKSQIQALDRTAPILPMRPGVPERQTHDYKRHGTSSLYAALDLSTGKVIGALHSRHRAIEFKKFLQTIDREVPADLTVHLVLDNSSTHKTPAIKKWLLAHPRFELHFTPTSSSWMNLVERWFGELTTKKRRGAHRSVRARRHPRLDRCLEQRTQALRLDQDRRPDPRIDQPLLHNNQRLRALAGPRQQQVALALGRRERGGAPQLIRLGITAEAAQDVGAGRAEQVVAGEPRVAGDRVQRRQRGFGPIGVQDRDRAVELDDRRRRQLSERVVEGDDRLPVGLLERARPRVAGGDRGLDRGPNGRRNATARSSAARPCVIRVRSQRVRS